MNYILFFMFRAIESVNNQDGGREFIQFSLTHESYFVSVLRQYLQNQGNP